MKKVFALLLTASMLAVALAGCGFLKDCGVGRVIECELCHAGAVAENDKDDTALIADRIYKSADGYGFSRLRHLAAVAGALHALHCVPCYP